MRILVVALLAVALTARAEAQVTAIPESHVLLLDRSVLKSDDPALDNSFETAVRDVESQIMARHQANLILDKSAAVQNSGGVDVTAEAAAALALAEPGWTPPQAIATAPKLPIPIAPARVLVVDTGRVRSSGTAKSDTEFSQVLDNIATSRHATIVLRRDIVVIGPPGSDVTALTTTSLDSFRKTGALSLGNGTDTPVARIGIIDRQALLRNSIVGKFIAARVRALVTSAEDEFRPEGLSLKKEGELLQGQTANIAPDEKERQTTDFRLRQDTFTLKVRQRQEQLRAAVKAAQKQVEDIAGPIVMQMARESGANLLVDRSVVVVGENALDMTALVMEKLNATIQSVALSLPAPETR